MFRVLKRTALALALAVSACGQTASEDSTPPSSAEPAEENVSPSAQYCAEVGRRIAQTDCDLLNHLADEAAAGIAAFNAPDPMARGEAHMLQLAIGFAPPPPAPAAEPPAPPASTLADDTRTAAEIVDALPGTTVQYAPLVGRFMRAELVGAGFEITPLTPAAQEVLADSVTIWSWRAIAREGGQRALTLTTVVEGCTGASQCYPLRSTSRNYPVVVTVGWLGRAQDVLAGVPTWIQLLSAVIAAFAGLALAFFNLRSTLRQGRGGGR